MTMPNPIPNRDLGTIVDGGIYSNAWSCINNNNIKYCIKTKQKMLGTPPPDLLQNVAYQ